MPADVTVNRGATVTVPYTNITRTGYWFLGWAESKTATEAQYKAGFTVVADKEVKTLYAVWLIRTYTLSFDANKGQNPPASKKYNYGTTSTVPKASVSREGYYFTGWSEDPSSNTPTYKSNSTIVMTRDVKLYAVWVAKNCTVEFDASKGEGKLPDKIVSKYDKTVEIGKTSVTREGYYFMGWSTDPKAQEKEYGTGSKIMLKGDLKLYAVWVPMTWTLSYSSNGVSAYVPPSVKVKTDQCVRVSRVKLQNDDYIFLGWSLDKNAKEADLTGLFLITIKNDTVLYAVWKHADCSLTFDLNGGESGAPEKITVEYGSTVTIPKSPSIKHKSEGVYFLGWSTIRTDALAATNADVDYISKADETHRNTIVLKENVTLYAVWRHYHSFEYAFCNPKTNVHQVFCAYCRQFYDGEHTIKMCVMTKNGVACGVHGHVCIDDKGVRCGYRDDCFEYCYKNVKSWDLYKQFKVYKNGDVELLHKLVGTCTKCGTKVEFIADFEPKKLKKASEIGIDAGKILVSLLMKLPILDEISDAWDVISTVDDVAGVVADVAIYMKQHDLKDLSTDWQLIPSSEVNYYSDLTFKFMNNVSNSDVVKVYTPPKDATLLSYYLEYYQVPLE